MGLGTLPAGTVIFDAVAQDGFSQATSAPVRVNVPKRPPIVAILHPLDRLTLQAGRTLRLQGMATEPGGEPSDPERCVWRIDGEEVARGFDAFLAAPDEGNHVVAFTAEGEGGRAEARVRVATLHPERGAPDASEP